MLSFLIRVANLKQGIPCFKLLLFCLELLELKCCSFNLSFQVLCTSLQVTVVGSWDSGSRQQLRYSTQAKT